MIQNIANPNHISPSIILHLHTFYIRDLTTFLQRCTLLNCPTSAWESTCRIVAGPKNLDVNECLGIDSGCETLRRGNCIIHANHATNTSMEDYKDCKVGWKFLNILLY